MKKIAFNLLLAASFLGAIQRGNSQNSTMHKDNSTHKTDDKVLYKDETKTTEKKEIKVVKNSDDQDAKFVLAAADAGMLEEQLGELSQTNGYSSQVKEFGKMMVEDHGKANSELKALAKKKNIVIPTALTEKSEKKYTDLSKKMGSEFDKEYMESMIKDHKNAIDEFQKEADKGKDADLKSWASNKLPVLKHHLQMAESTKDVGRK